jgi:hypothetical protein
VKDLSNWFDHEIPQRSEDFSFVITWKKLVYIECRADGETNYCICLVIENVIGSSKIAFDQNI